MTNNLPTLIAENEELLNKTHVVGIPEWSMAEVLRVYKALQQSTAHLQRLVTLEAKVEEKIEHFNNLYDKCETHEGREYLRGRVEFAHEVLKLIRE